MSVGGCGWKTAMFFPTSPCTARIARGAHNDAMQGSHDMAPTVNRYQPFTRKAASNQVSLFHIWSAIKTSTNNNPQIVPISGRVCLRASRIRQCGPHGWKNLKSINGFVFATRPPKWHMLEMKRAVYLASLGVLQKVLGRFGLKIWVWALVFFKETISQKRSEDELI